MVLLPMPAKIKTEKTGYTIGTHCKIILDFSCGFEEYESAKLLKGEIEQALPMKIGISRSFQCPEGAVCICLADSRKEDYMLHISAKGIVLTGGHDGIYWGVQTLRQIIRQCGTNLPGLTISDAPFFARRGFLHDVTRGKVPKLETLKELVDRISFYKINTLQLYVEHSFAFGRMSEAWAGKDPLTAEDILELDEYCRFHHVELIPSLATFGHLYEILTTKSYSKFCELEVPRKHPFCWYDRMAHHTIDVSNPDSFELVKSMLDEFMPLFSSGSFNICCDETFDIGKGKSAHLLEKADASRLYVDFLKKVCSYVQSKGKKVMFYGDIILKHPEYLPELPHGCECLYWNYDPVVDEGDIKALADSGIEFQVCPGVSGWNHLMNKLDTSFQNISNMVRFGKKFGAKGVLNTDWGDYGHINLFGNSMPGMAFGAGLSWNPQDTRNFEEYAEVVSILEFGKENRGLIALLNELSQQQYGTWKDIVCWHESSLTDNSFLKKDEERVKAALDSVKMLEGYQRALEIEAELVSSGKKNIVHSLDLMEFVVSAHGIALFDAACLSIKKYHYHIGGLEAMEPHQLAAEIEVWFTDYAELWRERNRESELFRIKDTVFDLCSYLREQNQSF